MKNAVQYQISYTIPEIGNQIRKYQIWAESPSEAKLKFASMHLSKNVKVVKVSEIF